MPTYQFSLRDFNKVLGGKPATIDELLQVLPNMAVPIDKYDEEKQTISVEVFANRPDMLGVEGLARIFAGITGRTTGYSSYTIEETDPFHVYVNPNVFDCRPYLMMAKVTNLKLDDEAVQSLFTFQEKLHTTHARNRKKSSIGLYDIQAGKLEPPIYFQMAKVNETKFIPLDETKLMTLKEVLEDTLKGKEYAHLVPKDQAPILIDKNKRILSLVPILNANESRVTTNTTEVFVDCTGTDWNTTMKAFNMILTALADRGGKIDPAILHYEYQTPGGQEVKLPNLDPTSIVIDPDYISKRLGINITAEQQVNLLHKARLGAQIIKKGKNKLIEVIVPTYRTDIMHPVDFVEEVAIAYGYQNIIPTIPKVVTTGRESKWQILKRRLANLYVGIGAFEVMTYILSSEDSNFTKMNLPITYEDIVVLSNPINILTTICRNWLLPSLMDILQRSKKSSYPQRIFEIGTVTHLDSSNEETGTRDDWVFCYTESSVQTNYNTVRAALATLEFNLDIRFTLKPVILPYLLEGRSAEIYFEDIKIGFIGEIHPKVLINWELDLPVGAFEITVAPWYNVIRKNLGINE